MVFGQKTVEGTAQIASVDEATQLNRPDEKQRRRKPALSLPQVFFDLGLLQDAR